MTTEHDWEQFRKDKQTADQQYSLLFIGMSLKDENVRRLLHYSRNEMRESYAKEKEPPDEAERKSIRHYTIQQYTGSDRLNEMTETSLLRLGVRVLWVNEFGEIPTRLGEMYESVRGARWSDVFYLAAPQFLPRSTKSARS